MMKSVDIRECNLLERNSKRLDKALKLLCLVIESNEVSELDLQLCHDKLYRARNSILSVRESIVRNAKHE